MEVFLTQNSLSNEEKIKILEGIISKANNAYWNDNKPIIPDVEYDRYIEELKSISPDNALLSHIGGAKGKYRHNPPMLSLNKAYSYEDVIKWAKSVSRNDDEMIFIQPKYDGLAGKIENNRLTTRGNGTYGEDITSHKDLVSVEHIINDKNSIDGIVRRYSFDKYISLIEIEQPVYGELLITNEIFEEYFASGKILRIDGSKYSNPRNAVAGLFNQKDISTLPKGIVTFVPYNNQSIGVYLNRFEQTIESNIKEIEKDYKKKYPLDGIVFKIYDKNHYESLGNTSHHPKGAIAFKFQNASEESTLIDIEYGIGKENITATAIFSTINLNGTNISRAVVPMQSKTLPCIMNGDFRKGSLIVVEKAGDIIPHITEIHSSDGEVFKISCCPFCGSEIEVTESSVRCKNVNCRKKKIHKLYESLSILGCKNIGETTVDILCKNILQQKFLDISLANWMQEFSDNRNFLKMSEISGFGELSSKKVIEETIKIKQTDLIKFIACLCIPNVGTKIGKEFSKKFKNIESLLFISISDISELDGIGDVMASRIVSYFKENNEYIKNLAKHFFFESKIENENSRKICFTGSMSLSRSEMSKLAKENGFQVIDSVTKDLNILVVSDNADMTSSKCIKAQKNNVKIIRESDFLNKKGF